MGRSGARNRSPQATYAFTAFHSEPSGVITQSADSTAALAQLAAAVGPAHVITDAISLRAAETSTFRTKNKIPAIVRPANRSEVQECLRIANRFHVPVYP